MAGVLHRITDEGKRPFSEAAKDGEMASLDEFVASGADVHLERMDDHSIWIGITVAGRLWHVNLSSGRKVKLTARVSDEGEAAVPH